MTPNNRALAVAAGVLLLSASASYATLAKAATFQEKVDNASSIILGRCVRTESKWDATGRWILTWSTFAVEKTMKGAALPEVTLVTPGGEVGGIHQQSIGIPAFAPGSEHVVFIRNTQYGPTVLYFDQGAYDVTAGTNGDRIVSPAASGLVRIDTQRGIAVSPDAPLPLSAFERRVDAAVQGARAERTRMELLQAKKLHDQASFFSVLQQNHWIALLAVAGVIFATWRLLR